LLVTLLLVFVVVAANVELVNGRLRWNPPQRGRGR
jgi:hypothetical protein